MFRCKRCNSDFRDGVQCTACQSHFDFSCAGITEGGYRKLGDRRNVWKCSFCKSSGASSPLNVPSTKAGSAISPTPADMESIALDLKRLSAQVSSLQALTASVQAIQADIAALKTMKADIADLKLIKPDVADMKVSMEFMQHSVEALTGRISKVDQQVQDLLKTKDEVQLLKQRFDQFECTLRENDQRSRLNNVEIKGVPFTNTENLFLLISKIGDLVKCPIAKEQVNYVARVPMRNDKQNKSIIVSIHNRYLKEDFVAAAKKSTFVPTDLGLQGISRIYVNDHLTLENKILLNKTKALAKERNFAYTWVKGCKIFIRKNPTSPAITIKSESDLQKLSR